MTPNAQRPTSRASLLGFLLAASNPLLAQQAPPDFHNEVCNPAVTFWKNQGQQLDNFGAACPQVLYASSGSPLSTYCLDSSRVTLAVTLRDTIANAPDTILNIIMRSAGPGRKYAAPAPWGERDHVRHFYLQHTAPNGAVAVPGFAGITYSEFIKDVDLSLHSGSGGPKLTLTCQPGFNPNHVVLGFEGQDSLRVDVEGSLKLWRDGKFLKIRQARAFQLDAQGNPVALSWNAEYLPDDNLNLVRFQFDTYDSERPLYLQAGELPVAFDEAEGLCWSSYLGDSGEENLYVSGTDTSGNYFVAGVTNSAYQFFPNAPGIDLQFAATSWPIFVTRFDPMHRIVWSAFYGGSGGAHAYPYGMAVRSVFDGTDVYIGGTIYTNDLYYWTQPNAYNDTTGTFGTANGLLARFDIDGILRWSTYLGNERTIIRSLDLDSLGRLVIAGSTEGPMPEPGSQPSGADIRPYSGQQDGFILALDESDGLRLTTHVGNTGNDNLFAVRSKGNRIVAVGSSYDAAYEPIQDGGANAYDQATFGGGTDLVLVEVDLDGAQQWGTFIGWEDFEYMEGLNALDIGPAGNIVLVAHVGASMPIVPGIGWHQYTPGDQAILEFGPDRALVWASTLGTGGNRVFGQCVRIDALGNIHLAGRILAQQIGESPLAANVELPGVYYQPEIITGSSILGADAFLMSWTPDHYLSLATYIGGEERQPPPVGGFPFLEVISTITLTPNYMYLAGTTSKVLVPDTSYFPLYNPGNDAWYQSIFNAQVPNGADAFVTAICIDAFTGMLESWAARVGSAIRLIAMGQDLWCLAGLPMGRHELMLFDARGRLPYRALIGSTGNLSEPFSTAGLAPGVYTARLQGMIGFGLKVPVTR